MTAQRRVLTAAAIVALLAFNLACPGGPPLPTTEMCDGAPATAEVDSLDGSARLETGGQGALMVVTGVEWIGGSPPSCALLDLRVVNASGTVVQSQRLSVPTQESFGGRGSSSIYTIVDQSASELCGATVEVESYGRAVVIPIEGWGCEPDAGPDGGMDAAAPVSDAGSDAAPAASDAGGDAAPDAGTDGAPAPDAGGDAAAPAPDAGGDGG